MSKHQELNIDMTLPASTTYDSGSQTLTPNEVTFLDQPTTNVVVISLSPASGTTINAVTSDQGLMWTSSGGGAWVSSALPMPAVQSSTTVNITVTVPGLIHDPTFKVNNKKRGLKSDQ